MCCIFSSKPRCCRKASKAGIPCALHKSPASSASAFHPRPVATTPKPASPKPSPRSSTPAATTSSTRSKDTSYEYIIPRGSETSRSTPTVHSSLRTRQHSSSHGTAISRMGHTVVAAGMATPNYSGESCEGQVPRHPKTFMSPGNRRSDPIFPRQERRSVPETYPGASRRRHGRDTNFGTFDY